LKNSVNRVVEMFGLTKEQNKLIGSLSKGYRQRVGLAQTLIHDPKVLILDEPTTGLDPNQITEIRELIREVSQEKTVLFSTHIMQEVQALCQRVVIINNGRIVADKAVSQLRDTLGVSGDYQTFRVSFENRVKKEELLQIPGVTEIKEEGTNSFLLTSIEGKDLRAAIFHSAVNNGWTLIELTKESNSLEQVFKELTEEGGAGD
jgi:ABC-2 type transport system ATP-binding protein